MGDAAVLPVGPKPGEKLYLNVIWVSFCSVHFGLCESAREPLGGDYVGAVRGGPLPDSPKRKGGVLSSLRISARYGNCSDAFLN